MDPPLWQYFLERLPWETLKIIRMTNRENRLLVSQIFFRGSHGFLVNLSPTALLQLSLINLDKNGAIICVYNEWEEALDWLILKQIYPPLESFNWVIKISKSLKLTKWFSQKMGIYGTQEDIDNWDNVDLWEWSTIKPSQKAIKTAIFNQNEEALTWLINRNFKINQDVINEAAERGLLPMLKFIWFNLNLLPTVDGANAAAKENQFLILLWLDQFHILPDFRGANEAAKWGHLNILKWLSSKDIKMTKEGFWMASRIIRNFDVIKFGVKKGFKLTKKIMGGIIRDGNLKNIKWAMKIWQKPPLEEWFQILLNGGFIDVLEWFQEMGWVKIADTVLI